MQQEIHFKLAAILFLMLLFFADLTKRQLRTKRTISFQFFLAVVVVALFFNVMGDLTILDSRQKMLKNVMKAVSYELDILAVCAFHGYIHALSCTHYQRNKMILLNLGLQLCIAIVVLLSPWTGQCFTITVAGELAKKPAFNIIVLIMVVYLLVDLYILWRPKCICTLKRKGMTTFLMSGLSLTLSVRFLAKPEYEILSVFFVVFVFIYYLSLQSPDFFVDNMTGAFNRNGFVETLRERIAYGKKTCCMVIRVRNFNSLQRIYGENVLREIQRRMFQVIENDFQVEELYHISLSSFGLIFDCPEHLRMAYRQLNEKLPNSWDVNGEMVNHEYNFYQLTYPDDCDDFDELIKRIHYARTDHENHHEPGSLIRLNHDTVEEAEAKRKVASLVEEAVMDHAIELNFQPIYSLKEKRITSLEVLARLKDEEKQYINPEFFIHVAEENHTIIPLGEQIFEKACCFAAQNHIFERGIEDMNINLSPGQCRYEKLTESLTEIARKYGIPMERIHLEITESEFTDAAAVEKTLTRLKQTGARVALDDFGTGYSTLANILELPVDFVKIDKSLLWSYADGKNQFLNDLMPMIKADGKRIIVEGVETEEHVEIIKNLHGDFMQGYFFSRPLPEMDFLRFVRKFDEEQKRKNEEYSIS